VTPGVEGGSIPSEPLLALFDVVKPGEEPGLVRDVVFDLDCKRFQSTIKAADALFSPHLDSEARTQLALQLLTADGCER